jgi:uncharacterized protein YggE
MATLTVQGRGVASAPPDEVSVALVASGYGDDAATAYAGAAERARELERLLDHLTVAAERRRTTAAFVQEVEEIPGRQAPGRFLASSRTVVTLADPESAQRLLLQAAERGVAFEGPSFDLSVDHPARLDACARAAEDAQRRAAAYAAALGSELGALLSAAEAATGGPARVASFGAFDFTLPIHAGAVDAVAVLDVTYELGTR